MHVKISDVPLQPFVAGRRVDGIVATHPTYDPATAEVIGAVPVADPALVGDAVAAAKAALKGPWAGVLPAERGRILNRVAAGIRRDAEYLALVESVDSGKPLREAKGDIETSARYFEYYAGICDKLQETRFRSGRTTSRSRSTNRSASRHTSSPGTSPWSRPPAGSLPRSRPARRSSSSRPSRPRSRRSSCPNILRRQDCRPASSTSYAARAP